MTSKSETTPRSDATQAIRFTVSGRVQGVGFRAWTIRRARELGLAGTVRNLSDGTVEIVASGSDTALDRLRHLLRHGPPGATVTRIEEAPVPAVPHDRFDVTA